MPDMTEELRHLGRELGLYDLGFFKAEDGPEGMEYGVSLAVRLSDAVVDEIDGQPTYSYFHHYRTVNAYLDQCMLRLGLRLQAEGYRYLPIPASQSVPTEKNPRGYHGRYSHKEAACRAGLGAMGKSGLFLHRDCGPRVRLGTVFTDCPLEDGPVRLPDPPCGACGLCAAACPAQAIRNVNWTPGLPEFSLVDPQACSSYMKRHFQHIGRGAVCGVCMRVCPRDGAGE